MVKRVMILGAAGRDFHNFNVFFRNNKSYKVVAFTMAQLPLGKRHYPKILSGRLYPKGIPIYPEAQLSKLIKKFKVDVCVFSYSDVSYNYVMRKSAEVESAGADFWILGPKSTMLKSKKLVISVCAVRTGAGKSQTSRAIAKLLRDKGKRVVVVRHPMPYGDLSKQITRRFETLKDLDKYSTTIEEREDYEPHINLGNVVYSGVDYEKILRQAEKEADIIIWDGGNNDLPFYKPDLHIVVVDPLRAGDEINYYPGEANARLADLIIMNKSNLATKKQIKTVEDNIKQINPKVKILKTISQITVDDPQLIRGKKAIILEDGPSFTHGGITQGVGMLAAKKYKSKSVVDAKKYMGKFFKNYIKDYPKLSKLKILPAIGYSKQQMKELEKTVNKAPADVVIVGTPTNFDRYLKFNKPAAYVRYEMHKKIIPTLRRILFKML